MNRRFDREKLGDLSNVLGFFFSGIVSILIGLIKVSSDHRLHGGSQGSVGVAGCDYEDDYEDEDDNEEEEEEGRPEPWKVKGDPAPAGQTH